MNADPVGGAGTPEWVYTYDPAFPDNLLTARDPAGVVTRYGYGTRYNAGQLHDVYPLLTRIETPGVAGAQDSIEYFTDPARRGLPQATVSAANAQGGRSRDTYDYDALGNLRATQSAGGKRVEYTNDAIGRVLVAQTRLDTLPTVRWLLDSTWYDVLDRVTQTTRAAWGDGTPGSAPQALTVTTTYLGATTLPVAVRRAASGSPVGTLRDSMTYDALGRLRGRWAQGTTAPEWLTYDAAGNVTHRVTARGDTLRYGYDALNRLAWRVTPSVAYDSARVGTATYAPADWERSPAFPWLPIGSADPLKTDADTAVFTYHFGTGQLETANNSAAQVSRTYLTNGALSSETQKVREVNSASFGTHTYTLTYTYDVAGRRATLQHPSQLSAGTATESWAYDPLTGRPAQVTDPLGGVVGFEFDPAGQLIRQTAPGNVTRRLGYGLDGELRADSVSATATGAGVPIPVTAAGWARLSILTYDARGKLATSVNSVGTQENLAAEYSPLGHLRRSSYSARGVGATGNTATWIREERTQTDALGTTLSGESQSSTAVTTTPGFGITGGGHNTSWQSSEQVYATDGTGRLLRARLGAAWTAYTYDAAGNVTQQVVEGQAPPATAVNGSDRVAYYDAAGQLVAVDARKGPVPGPGRFDAKDYSLAFESFRYDALGRRVLSRVQRRCPWQPTYWAECGLTAVQRTVWDGSRELYEIRMPDTPGWRENDAALPTTGFGIYQPPGFNYGENFASTVDLNPLYGRVGYVYAGAVDRPLAVLRIGYGDRPFDGSQRRPYQQYAPFALYPQWDHRGMPGLGSTGDGGLWPCVGSGTSKRCTYPLAWTELWASNGVGSASGSSRPAWVGSLVEDKKDVSGLLYRRNRYVDPSTGRFTQPDPIGLAGGLSSYGFAAGDPVNYSDPFGLCTPMPECLQEALQLLRRMGPAMEKAIGIGTAVSMAPAAVAAAGSELAAGGAISALGVARPLAGRTLLPAVPTAIVKLQSLGERFGVSATQLANRAITSGTKFIDNAEANAGNINALLPRIDGANGWIRVTLDPTQSRIISAGLQSANQLINGLKAGRFTPFQ